MNARNPFSTCYTNPGSVEFLEPSPALLKNLGNRLLGSDSISQIVGPHGSGKTTLTVSLAQWLLENHNVTSGWLTLKKQSRFSRPRVRLDDYLQVAGDRQSQVNYWFIDGIECLSFVQRVSMLRSLHRQHQLVITTHRRIFGCPLLFRSSLLFQVESDLRFFRRLCGRLVDPDWHPQWSDEVDSVYTSCKGNIREAFFQLYDRYDELSSELHGDSVAVSAR